MISITTTTRDPLDASIWLFDLDNTLYAHRYNLFHQVSARMTQFIMQNLSLPAPEAKALQKKYFHLHGTTMHGLMKNHGTSPQDFLRFVHDIDYSVLPCNPALDKLLGQLKAKKIIFTNGSTEHAQSVCERLGISHHFAACFDITDANYMPKPAMETYHRLITQYNFAPEQAIMLEDMAINLEPAKALGMQTVWLKTPEDWAAPAPGQQQYIDHHADDLTDWLDTLMN